MDYLFQTRLNKHTKTSLKNLVSILSNSGVFLLIPFLMLAVYATIHFFNQGQLTPLIEAVIVASLFLIFVCNHRIRSFITDQDDIYLAPQITKMDGYFTRVIRYNLFIQLIKCSLFILFLLALLNIQLTSFIILAIALLLSAMLHVFMSTIIISMELRFRPICIVLYYFYCWIMAFFLFYDIRIFIGMVSLAVFSLAIWLTKNRLFPIYSWKRLSLADERADSFLRLFMSNFTNVPLSLRPARGRNLLITLLTFGNDQALPFLLARSFVRGTESGRLFTRVLLITIAILLLLNNIVAMFAICTIMIALNTRQFAQGFPSYKQMLPPHYPVEPQQFIAAINQLKKRALLLQIVLLTMIILLRWLSAVLTPY